MAKVLPKQKIMALIYRRDSAFLALRVNPAFGEGRNKYFVVTGGIEAGELPAAAVRREVKEETGLKVVKIYDLKSTLKYFCSAEGGWCDEHVFAAAVAAGPVILNEEHVGYRWLRPKDFLKKVSWRGDKKVLENYLAAALGAEPG